MYKIRFESENYFFYLNNFVLKKEYHDKNKVLELVNEFDNFFSFKLVEILYIDNFSGLPETLYKFNKPDLLPDDKDEEPSTTLKFVYIGQDSLLYRDYETIVGGFKNNKFTGNNELENLVFFINKYFSPRMNYKFLKIEHHESSTRTSKKYLKKRNIGKQWNLSHKNAYGSKIEEILGNELKKLNINFKIQQKIFGGSKLMTIPDFYIEEANLVIYCDGFEYHYDKDTVIKDRQQDRRLQYMDYKVLRFTGSEIVGDVRKCVDEIQYFIKKFKNK
ncbi:MAG: DUF559 domain-containing protein [Candidatus Sericytochromatia bacterium]